MALRVIHSSPEEFSYHLQNPASPLFSLAHITIEKLGSSALTAIEHLNFSTSFRALIIIDSGFREGYR